MSIQVEISRDVLVRDLNGEAVILDLKSQRYFGLDDVGLATWQLLSQHRELDVVMDKMLEEFDVERSRLAEDLETFLQRLEAEGLVTVHGRQAAEAQRGGDVAAQTP